MISYPTPNFVFCTYVLLSSVLRVKFLITLRYMMIRFFPITLILLGSFSLLAQSSLNNTKTLVVATYQDGNNPRLKNIEPFSIHLGEVAGVKTTVKSYPTVQLLLLAMYKGEVDIAFVNTFGYLILREQTTAYEISATLHLPDRAADVNKSVIVTPNESRLQSLEDGVKNAGDYFLILVSPGSTLGNIIPRLKLASMMPDDPELFFVEVQYAQQQDAVIQNMLTEKFSIAAVGSDAYYKLGPDTVKVSKLWESPPIPLGPVVCKKDLPENLKNSLKKALLELHEQNPEALESIKTGWAEAKPTDGYMLVDDAYYDSLIKLAGNKDRAMKIIRKFAR